eukprot:TRINITY_DN96183_c0_g1_i1.p1 TRINITY_DN96183_c0_g1~~TRINITY_DN96183_c0_g1_i1.p1  ORF type:complete len:665 (-),score=251.53 TRINITY_DN96183_c0_g1_i1:101-2095(-)
MQQNMAKLAALVAILGARSVSAAEAKSLEQVTEMLKTMLQKGKDERQAEEVQYSKYNIWCGEETTSKKRDIKNNGQKISQLTADIKLETSKAGTLGDEIELLEADLERWNKSLEKGNADKTQEIADFDKLNQEYKDAIMALQKAISSVKEGKVNQAPPALLQFAEAGASVSEVTSFLSDYLSADVQIEQAQNPGYRSGTMKVQTLLERLQDKFKDEKAAAQKDHTHKVSSLEQLIQELELSIKTATNTKKKKEQNKAKAESTAADKTSQKEDTVQTKEDDEKYLDEVTTTCNQKTSDFKSRSELRNGEIDVIAKAIELLSGSQVKATASRVALVQKSKTALAMLRSSKPKEQERVASYLHKMSSKLSSSLLATLALRADEDPLAKVKGMVDDLIAKLEADTGLDKEAQAWCDKEMPVNEKARVDGAANVEKLTNDIDAATADVAQLTQDMADLTKSLADNAKSFAEATAQRNEEKAVNTLHIKDAKAAQAALTSALTQLQDFYGKAAEATALVQTSKKTRQAPEIFDAAYKGNQDGASGMLDLLQTILADYTELETSTTTAENTASDEYATLSKDQKELKEQQTKDLEHATARKADQEQNLVTWKDDLATGKKELTAALEYHKVLFEKCDMQGEAVKKRQERIAEEIATLQNAKRLLNQEEEVA